MNNMVDLGYKKLRSFLFILTAFTSFAVMEPLVGSAAASTLYFDAPQNAVAPESEFKVKVLINSSVPLNAYNIAFSYSPEVLSLLKFDDSDSLIDVWQTQPTEAKEGIIQFVGGSIEPFSGSGGELIAIYFKTLKEGDVSFTFQFGEAYIADGKGTPSAVDAGNLTVAVRKNALRIGVDNVIDEIPPEIEAAALTADPFNDKQNILTLAVKDKETGVKETRVRVRTWFLWNDWQRAENPIAFRKNVWAVEVQALDNAGNLTAQVIYNWPAFFTRIFPIVLAILLVAFGFYRRIRHI